MSSTDIGKKAEASVGRWLHQRGYAILERNWKTRLCEIDIIARKDDIVFFIEVKYRKSQSQGGGLEYITHRKLKQLRFSADMWNSHQDWSGDWRLLAAEVSGDDFENINIVELD